MNLRRPCCYHSAPEGEAGSLTAQLLVSVRSGQGAPAIEIIPMHIVRNPGWPSAASVDGGSAARANACAEIVEHDHRCFAGLDDQAAEIAGLEKPDPRLHRVVRHAPMVQDVRLFGVEAAFADFPA